MRNILRILLFVVVSISFASMSMAAESKAKPAQITIQIQVKGPSNLDMKNVSIDLLGMSRPILEVMKTTQPDAQGLASFTFLDVDWETASANPEPTACQGLWHITATASGTAGAVSPILYLDTETPSFDDATNEWGEKFQKPLNLRDLATKKQPLMLTLEQGKTFKGKILTSDQKPCVGAKISIFMDLHGDSHTGKGREIFPLEATTDQQGMFTFSQVYPNTIYIGEITPSEKEGQSSLFWKTTRVGGKTFEYPENTLPLASQTPDLDMTLILSKDRYLYSGTVQTKDGKPVAEAGLNMSVAYHPDARDFIDSHTFVDGKTDAQGKFTMETDAPFVNTLTITKEGFKEVSLDNENASPAWSLLKPGSHTFTLEKE